MSERIRRRYTKEFKKEAVALVTEQNYSVTEAASSLGISRNRLDRWRREYRADKEDAFPATWHESGQADELRRLR